MYILFPDEVVSFLIFVDDSVDKGISIAFMEFCRMIEVGVVVIFVGVKEIAFSGFIVSGNIISRG